jgi:hypothetical protein
MANESLFPNGGSSSGPGSWGFTGGSNLWDGIDNGIATPVDGEFDSVSGASVEGTVLTLDLTSTTIADADTVTNIDIKIRADGVDADDGLDVELVIGGTGQGVVSQAITSTTTDYTLNTAAWNVDRTAAQLNGAQVTISNTQAGMPTSSTWTVYEVEVDITFTPAAADFTAELSAVARSRTVPSLDVEAEIDFTAELTAIAHSRTVPDLDVSVTAAFPSGWDRVVKLSSDNTKVAGSGSHTDIVLLVDLSNVPTEAIDDGSNSAKVNGDDLAFSSDRAGTSRLDIDVVNFIADATPGNRKCLIKVKIPSLSTSADTDVHMWYKNAAATLPAVGNAFGQYATWSNEELVLEFANIDAADVTDRTGNHTVSDVGTFSASDDDGLSFDGSTNYFSVPDAAGLDFSTAVSLRAFASDVNTTAEGHIISKPVTSGWTSPFAAYAMRSSSAEKLEGWVATSSTRDGRVFSTTDIATGTTPHHLAFTYDQINGQIHVDGTEEDTDAATLTIDNTAEPLAIGTRSTTNTGEFFNGILKSIQIRGAFLTDGWISTESNNLSDPANFWNTGTPESAEGFTAELSAVAQSRTIPALDIEAEIDFTAELSVVARPRTIPALDVEAEIDFTADLSAIARPRIIPALDVEAEIDFTSELTAVARIRTTPDIDITVTTAFSADLSVVVRSRTVPALDVEAEIDFTSELSAVARSRTVPDIDITVTTAFNADLSAVARSRTEPALDVEAEIDFTAELTSVSRLRTIPALDIEAEIDFNADLSNVSRSRTLPDLDVEAEIDFTSELSAVIRNRTIPALDIEAEIDFTAELSAVARSRTVPDLDITTVIALVFIPPNRTIKYLLKKRSILRLRQNRTIFTIKRNRSIKNE